MLSSAGSSLGTASRDVIAHARVPYMNIFEARWGFIVTWHNVTFSRAAKAPYPVIIYDVSYFCKHYIYIYIYIYIYSFIVFCSHRATGYEHKEKLRKI